MRPSQRIAMLSLGISAVIGLVAIPWAGFRGWLILTLLVAGGIYPAIIKQTAAERLVDRDHDPDQPAR